VCLALSLGVGAVGLPTSGAVATASWTVATACAAIGAAFAVAAGVHAVRASPRRVASILGALALLAINGTLTFFGSLLALLSSCHCF
jgi:hypothetical protein